jgi:hypothetical protein
LARIHAAVDNDGARTQPKVRAHPRSMFHFTPTSASWRNAVETFRQAHEAPLKRDFPPEPQPTPQLFEEIGACDGQKFVGCIFSRSQRIRRKTFSLRRVGFASVGRVRSSR